MCCAFISWLRESFDLVTAFLQESLSNDSNAHYYAIPYLRCPWLQLVAVVSQPQSGHYMLQRTEVLRLAVRGEIWKCYNNLKQRQRQHVKSGGARRS